MEEIWNSLLENSMKLFIFPSRTWGKETSREGRKFKWLNYWTKVPRLVPIHTEDNSMSYLLLLKSHYSPGQALKFPGA